MPQEGVMGVSLGALCRLAIEGSEGASEGFLKGGLCAGVGGSAVTSERWIGVGAGGFFKSGVLADPPRSHPHGG